jgi:hypothetical protein
MTRASPILILLLLAACARSEDATMLPAEGNQATRTVESVRPERDDDELALGEWRETLQDEQQALEFGPTGAPPLFSLRCDARRGILLQRHGLEPSGDLPVMLISVGSETRRLAVTGSSGANPMLRAAVPASDALTAAIGRAVTPITVRLGDSAPLNLPPSPMIGAHIAQCASSGASGRGSGDADGNGAATANAADAGD